ncbi:hypothetical protein [Nocardia sp. CA-120079]|uniref:hypothetical protein n=1 Tax=Nocardia sp. CA-120079 TaxID=3239974 RepID=UPI003D962805
MIRRCVLVLAAAGVLAGVGAGGAKAQPTPAPTPGSGPAAVSADSASLPPNFPADLKKFIGGTAEFKTAEWFTGACAGRGGDMGAYLSGMLTNENRLLWWSLPDEQKVALLSGIKAFTLQNTVGTKTAAEQFVRDGKEPADEFLPKVFPAGDSEYHPPRGMCATDLKGWATTSANTWGFEWSAPDTTSLRAMKTVPGATKVPDKAWTEPCGSEELGVYCSHAFFLNCNKADNGGSYDTAKRCRDWNAKVGHLFAGTANWIDQNTSFGDRVDAILGGAISKSPQWQYGKWVTTALSGIASAVSKVSKFIEDPSSIADDWANSMKPAAIEFSTKVLKSLASTSHFDPGSDWFLRLYAVSVAIGFVVMGFMVLGAIQRSARGGAPREMAMSLFWHLPMSVFLALFAPGFAALILAFTNSLSQSMAEWGGTPTGELIANIGEFNNATAASFPGGSLLAIIMFGLMMMGALVVWLGLMVHEYGLPLAGAVSGISIFMTIHPKYRHKALRPVFLFLGIAFSTPMLFFLLAVVFTAANAVYADAPGTGMGQVAQVFQVAVAMLLVGMAPWALLKWAPILPTAADSEDFGGGSSLIGDTVGAAGNAMLYTRLGGIGGQQPATRSDSESGAGRGGGEGAGSGATASGPSEGKSQSGQASNPLARAYREKGDQTPVGGGAHPGVAGGKESSAGTRTAASSGEAAAAGVASGGASIAAAVGVQAVSSAINKAKSTTDDVAPRAEDDR